MPETASTRLLANRYRLIERLGSGGMATVFLAEDERLGRRVAVKRLHADSPDDTAKRFAREARLGAALNHPNLVTIYDTVTDDEAVVIVMEYVEGETLAGAIKRGPLQPSRVAEVICQIGAALDHAHGQGIVHRDIKPANILLGKSGAAKLVDLGIAVAVEGTRITRADSVVGTAAYMAPELLDGREAGPAADVYALAVVAFEALTGRRAYRGTTPIEIAHQVIDGPPPDLATEMPEAPAEAREVLRRAMSPEPADRPSSAVELADQLAAAFKSPAVGQSLPERHMPAPVAEPRAAVAPPAPSERPSSAPPAPREPVRVTHGSGPRRRPVLLAALAALLLVVGVGAFLLLSGGGDDGGGGSGSELSAAEKQAQDERKTARREAREEREAREREAAAEQQNQAPAPSGSGSDSDADSEAASPPEEPAPDSGGSYSVPQAAGSDPGRGAALQTEGHQLLNAGKYDEAIPVLEDAVRQFPPGTDDLNYAYSLFDLGSALRQAGRPEDAIPVLEERLKIDNQRDVVERELALAREAAGE